MKREIELEDALEFLSNNWRLDPTLREAFDAIFKTLSSGSKAARANAEVLRKYLAYPGSDAALSAAHSLHASLLTSSGRRAAGLPPRRRGRACRPEEVKLEDSLMQVMIKRELGRATDYEVDIAAIDRVGVNVGDATRQSFVQALRPRVSSPVKWTD